MRKAILSIGLTMLVLAFAGMAKADTVNLNLFDLGCPTKFDFNSPYWQTDFDLGVTFSEISHVYIDWSGEITAGLAIHYSDPCNPFPAIAGVYASILPPFPFRHAGVWGGEQTYPAPEPFDSISEINPSTWSDLLDGQATIYLSYDPLNIGEGAYIEYGSVVLDKANLIVEGIIPEPSSLCLIGLGCLWTIRKSRRNKFN